MDGTIGFVSGQGVPPIDPRVARTRNDVLAAGVHLLTTEGWDAITHARVAKEAGYAKGTVYVHWPERIDLLRDTLAAYGQLRHHEPTGNLRTDLIGELSTFRTALENNGLDRVLAALAERAGTDDEIASIRQAFVADGEGLIRHLLASVCRGEELDAATFMLCGTVLHAALLHDAAASDDAVAFAVDAVLARVAPPKRPSRRR
jgi:AcrR family transcriptional regulator